MNGLFLNSFSQEVDHWETIINNNDIWNYKIGSQDIPLNWIEEGFDAGDWSTGPGGFGYGDGDDNTILNDIVSVFLLKDFEVLDKNIISELLLHADFDDGFVAYLNGIEIARKNLGVVGERVSYDASTPSFLEAQQFQGLLPVAIPLDPNVLKNGTNTLAIQVHNYLTDSSDLSSNFYLSARISNETSYYNDPPDWFNKSVFESSLPIIKIVTATNEAIVDEPRIKAHMGIIDNGFGNMNSPFDPFNNYNGAIAIELRGTSSLFYEKKGYGFETQNDDGSNNNVALLGLPEENDWVFHGPYSDKSLLRNVLTYHLGNLTGRYAPKTKLCELFVNDEYLGVYVLAEKIKQDKNRVDIAKLTEDDNQGDDLTGGYIIKVDRNDQNIPGLGWESSFPDFKFFAFVEPKDDDITTAQQDYIMDYMFNFESAMAGNDFEERYTDYIDVESLVDYFLVTEIGKHIDAYKLSFYMYKDKDSKGGKLHFGPLWDFNFGYGNFDFDCNPGYDGWAYEFPDCGSWHPFWARKILDIPNVQHLSSCRWEELRSGPFRTDSILAFIDEREIEMGEAVDRNFERWPILGQYVWANDFIGEDYDAELTFLKTWLVNRLEWLDANMQGNCDLFVSSTNEKPEDEFQIFPNPTSQRLNIISGHDVTTELEIYNTENQLVSSIAVAANTDVVIDVSRYTNGLYTLMFKSENQGHLIYVDKLVVLK